MIEPLQVEVTEHPAIPEPYVAVFEIRCLNPDLYDNPKPRMTLFLKPGHPVDELQDWLKMRLETLPVTGIASDQFNVAMDGDEVVAQTSVRMVELPPI